MAIDLKQQVRTTMEEVFAKGNFDYLDGVCAAGYRAHDPVDGGDLDLAAEKEIARTYRTAFPDLKPTFLKQWIDADGDTVVTNWSMTGTHQKPLPGIPPTNRRCTVTGCTITHFEGGRITEEWVQWDALGLMRQLGVAPSPQPGARQQQEARPH